MHASAYHSSLQDQHKLPICYSDQHEPSYYHYKTKGTLLWMKQQALYLAIQHYFRIILFCQFYLIHLPYNRKEKRKKIAIFTTCSNCPLYPVLYANYSQVFQPMLQDFLGPFILEECIIRKQIFYCIQQRRSSIYTLKLH